MDEPSLQEAPSHAGQRRRRSGTDVEVARGTITADDVSADRAVVLSAAEARYHREEHLDLAQTRAWGVVAVVVGLVGAGAALFAVSSDTVKIVIPIAVAIFGALAGVAAAYSPHGNLRHWVLPGARKTDDGGPDSLSRIGAALEDQRREARRSAVTVWRGA